MIAVGGCRRSALSYGCLKQTWKQKPDRIIDKMSLRLIRFSSQLFFSTLVSSPQNTAICKETSFAFLSATDNATMPDWHSVLICVITIDLFPTPNYKIEFKV